MSRSTVTHSWFIVGHSIGVTLLALHTLETAYFSLPANERGQCFVVVNGSGRKMYEEMLVSYPHITVVNLHVRSFPRLLGILLRTLGNRHLVFFPLSFGRIHKLHRLLARCITSIHLGSATVGFVSEGSNEEMWLTHRLTKKLQQSIFRSLEESVAATGLAVQPRQPHLLYSHTHTFLDHLPQPYVVIQPFAASAGRTLPTARWVDLVTYIRKVHPHYAIVISGGPSDEAKAQTFLQLGDNIFFAGTLSHGSIARDIELIAGAALYVGVDTGPTHIAAHVGVPTILIGNNSNPCWLPTYNKQVTILMNTAHCTCTGDKQGNCTELFEGQLYYRCMLQIPQDEIKNNISTALQHYEKTTSASYR